MSSFLEKMKQQKLLSVTLLLITLALGIVLGTLINTGVKAAKDGLRWRLTQRRSLFPKPRQ